jgi:ATP-dependent DNA helicase RecG
MKDRVHFLKTHLEPLLLAGWIERTIQDKPRSSKQKSRLTENGHQALQKHWGGGR